MFKPNVIQKIFYHPWARLSKKDEDSDNVEDENGEGSGSGEKIRKNPAMSSTVFLGKMMSRKDKHGLIRGGSNSDEEIDMNKDNPVIVALEKVKLKNQTSLDSESRAGSRVSHIR